MSQCEREGFITIRPATLSGVHEETQGLQPNTWMGMAVGVLGGGKGDFGGGLLKDSQGHNRVTPHSYIAIISIQIHE